MRVVRNIKYIISLFLFSLILSNTNAGHPITLTPTISTKITTISTNSSLSPNIYWVNHPVYPNQTVLAFGVGLQDASISLCDSQVR